MVRNLKRLLLTSIAVFTILAGCNVVDGPSLEISDRSASESVTGFFDYTIEVRCTVYNSGEKGGQAKVVGSFIQSGQTYEKRTSGGVAVGDERTFTFTFSEAVLSFEQYQYNCHLE